MAFPLPAGYNQRINKEQGGSVLTVASGGSLNFAAGGKLDMAGTLDVSGVFSSSGTAAFTSASVQVGDSASLIVAPNPVINAPIAFMSVGRNKFWYGTSSTSPTHSASPGDLLWIAQGASTGLWANVGDGTATSKWTPMAKIAGSQSGGAH